MSSSGKAHISEITTLNMVGYIQQSASCHHSSHVIVLGPVRLDLGSFPLVPHSATGVAVKARKLPHIIVVTHRH